VSPETGHHAPYLTTLRSRASGTIDIQEMIWKFRPGLHEYRGVSLKDPIRITPEEDTPLSIRIQLSTATVKALYNRLQQAYRKDDARVVRRTTVLIDLLVHQVPVAVLSERWGLSPSCLYDWQKAFLWRGLDSLVYGHGGGRGPQLTPKQKNRLVDLIAAGPLVVGLETACWHAVLIRVLSWREFGGLSHRHYVCTLRHNWGFSFHKARFVSAHLDPAKRLAWLAEKWPAILRAATRRGGLILFADAASFAQWGSLSDTWSRRGRQPAVPTSGKRTGSKVCGALASFSGRLLYQSIEGRLNSESSPGFGQMLMEQTTPPLFLIHDGARYHTSAATQAFLAAHRDRITVEPRPSYSPDDKPIAYLWKKTKQRATHNKYCKECAALTVSVDKALAYFATHPETVLGLLGRYCEESGLELKQAA
jgi:transposase